MRIILIIIFIFFIECFNHGSGNWIEVNGYDSHISVIQFDRPIIFSLKDGEDISIQEIFDMIEGVMQLEEYSLVRDTLKKGRYMNPVIYEEVRVNFIEGYRFFAGIDFGFGIDKPNLRPFIIFDQKRKKVRICRAYTHLEFEHPEHFKYSVRIDDFKYFNKILKKALKGKKINKEMMLDIGILFVKACYHGFDEYLFDFNSIKSYLNEELSKETIKEIESEFHLPKYKAFDKYFELIYFTSALPEKYKTGIVSHFCLPKKWEIRIKKDGQVLLLNYRNFLRN